MDINYKLKELLSSSENEVLEFKHAQSNFDLDEIWKYFSALSNEANLHGKKEARLVFWVNDKKQIVWTNYRNNRKSLDSLKKEIWDHTTNRISFIEIHEIIVDGKRVILFQIPSAMPWIPVAWKWQLYWRDWESLVALNPEKYERIRSKSYDRSAEICEWATIDDLDPEAIKRARELYKWKNPNKTNDIDSWNDVTFLNKAKLTINDKITNTAILLLWRWESEHYLTSGIAKITWILKDRDNVEKDYQHFSCPFLLSVNEVYSKIRNLKYRYIVKDSLFPEEVDKYDMYTIREALNNCIAHQDYTLWWRINLVENEDSLIFSNMWSFIPQTVENVIESDAPTEYYRNRFLAAAMVNLNMIDTIWSWIKTMFKLQSKKFFPLPEYDISNNRVSVTIIGKVLDINYARKLAKVPNLTLNEIMLLDKIQKWKQLTNEEIKVLKAKNLIEWKKPNIYISSDVAEKTDQKERYIKQRWFNDKYYKDLIIEYLHQFKKANRENIDNLLWDKLSSLLDEKQKKAKVWNILYTMSKRENKIRNVWTTRKPIRKLCE